MDAAFTGNTVRILFVKEENVLFLVEDTNVNIAKDARKEIRFFLTSQYDEISRSLCSLARVSLEARNEFFRRLDVMHVQDGFVPFDPKRDTACICPRLPFRKAKPMYSTAAAHAESVLGAGLFKFDELDLFRSVQPLPQSLRLLALDCSDFSHDNPDFDLYSVMALLILASEADSLRLLNYNDTFKKPVS